MYRYANSAESLSVLFGSSGTGAPLALSRIIAGPCSAESAEQLHEVATQLLATGIGVLRAGVWKPRSVPGGFEGYGTEALEWLTTVRSATGIRIGTEIGTAAQARQALDYDLDYLWIGARTTSSPFAIEEIARVLHGTQRPLLIKNPIAPDLSLWHGAILRLCQHEIPYLIPVLRGFGVGSTGRLRNAPLWHTAHAFRTMHPDLPLLCDPSHIAGDQSLLGDVISSALSQGVDGLMIEVHPHPDQARTDARQQVSPQQLSLLQDQLSHMAIHYTHDSASLSAMRQELQGIDEEIIRLLAQRDDLCRQIGEWKAHHHMPPYQPAQYLHTLQQRTCWAEQVGADTHTVAQIYEIIHHHSIEIQHTEEHRDH